jgi:HK97 family phage major capsid protein
MNQALMALYAKRAAITGDLDEVRAKYTADPSKGLLERVDNLKRSTDSISKEIVAELGQAHARGELGEEPGVDLTSGPPATRTRTLGGGRDEALRSISALGDSRTLNEVSAVRAVSLIKSDKLGHDSEYLAAVADPDYEQAFARSIGNPEGAARMLSDAEHRAMTRVGRAMSVRSIAIGGGSTGGFAVPIALDPTIQIDNAGAVNPIRELADVRTISTSVWKGVKSAGVEFKFGAEASETADGSPTLSQPEITPTRATCWIPYSIESGEDWPNLSGELQKLLADAKAVKEAEVFATGTGATSIPQGLITGATEIRESLAKEVLAVADIYAMEEALSPRWQPNGTWLGSNAVANKVHRMVAAADATNAPLMGEDRKSILGKPFQEVSTISNKITTKNEKVLVYGDIESAYKIIDRVGMSIELAPLIFGTGGTPTGQRGLYAHYRVGAGVVAPHAVQVLKVKNE